MPPSLPVMVTWVAFVAVTVKVDELPAPIEAGLATMVIVGVGAGVIVTVAIAEALPPVPVAAAAYVVVAMGLTVCVPPAAERVYALPSVPLTVTWVAFVAFTVRVEEPPALMEVGLAIILTVGVAAGPLEPLDSLFLKLAPHPAISTSMAISDAGSNVRERDRRMFTLFVMRSLIFVRYRTMKRRF